MSQRPSGYARKNDDLYETPEWVTRALTNFINYQQCIWEPSAGNGKMLPVLKDRCDMLVASDLKLRQTWPNYVVNGGIGDFLQSKLPTDNVSAIITNPPFNLAEKFCFHSLGLMYRHGMVAMLLRTDFDHAKSRDYLFKFNPFFSMKIVLTKRIVWFERTDGKKAAPSYNHAWFVWDYKHKGKPIIEYY